MRLKNYLMILSLLALTSCAWLKSEPEIVTVTQVVEQEIPIVSRPKNMSLNDVSFYVVSEENFEEFRDTFLRENGLFTFFAISVRDYEALSLNMAELKRYLEQQEEIIIYYESALSDKDHESDDS